MTIYRGNAGSIWVRYSIFNLIKMVIYIFTFIIASLIIGMSVFGFFM